METLFSTLIRGKDRAFKHLPHKSRGNYRHFLSAHFLRGHLWLVLNSALRRGISFFVCVICLLLFKLVKGSMTLIPRSLFNICGTLSSSEIFTLIHELWRIECCIVTSMNVKHVHTYLCIYIKCWHQKFGNYLNQ